MSRNWPEADDPCIVLQRKQECTCASCHSLATQKWMGVTKFVCRRGKQKASTDMNEMRRCREYSETENPNIKGVTKE